jgi:hypothetical protein
MSIQELIPTLHELNKADKLRVVEFLVRELQSDEEVLPSGTYPIWSPYDSDEAARGLEEVLARGRDTIDE